MVEMHESDQVIWQIWCTQHIPPQPQELDDLHKIDMRGRLEEDWTTFHKKYIEFWHKQYEKPYLLSVSKRSRQHRCRRTRRGHLNPRSGGNVAEGSTSTPHAHKDSIVVQPLGQYGSFIPVTI
ncbi:hypothetical protein Goshw_024703 [Gossypium schwendimanii]|uniref:Aminotransferase-like plant mobile domain-containing protein n=1 Tax=Gossypium schwendimanii TaxID=34291 RepID=A0A7J9LBW5_GOSSC|nr:hypothetical protein [Gossypium schwendimanii]